MNKKVVLISLAVITFFAGQIFLESALSAAGAPSKTFAEFLVPVFSMVAGGFLGYFWKKYEDEATVKNYMTQYTDVKAEMIHMENEIIKLKAKKLNDEAPATKEQTTLKKKARKITKTVS